MRAPSAAKKTQIPGQYGLRGVKEATVKQKLNIDFLYPGLGFENNEVVTDER